MYSVVGRLRLLMWGRGGVAGRQHQRHLVKGEGANMEPLACLEINTWWVQRSALLVRGVTRGGRWAWC